MRACVQSERQHAASKDVMIPGKRTNTLHSDRVIMDFGAIHGFNDLSDANASAMSSIPSNYLSNDAPSTSSV